MGSDTLRTRGVPARAYSRAEFSALHAPPEKAPSGDKLRRQLRRRFQLRAQRPERSFLLAAGAHDAMTAGILADLGYEAVYASGEQLAAARGPLPDAGLAPSHQLPELVRELGRGIEAVRDRRFFESGGEVADAPPIFADVPGADGPLRAFALARELIRAGAAGARVERSPSWLETLVAVKAAAQAEESPLVVIACADRAESALEAAALGVDVLCAEFSGTDLEGPRRFARDVHAAFPEQVLGFDLSASLPWGETKKRGALPGAGELGALGFSLQFSAMFAFHAAGMALESWLRGFRGRGLDALADLQLVESGSLGDEPRTRRPRRFAGADRWLALDRKIKAAARRPGPG
ncbi:MAG: isocitrate lyase/phosphoenolpyruvate mutase family protein [Elusimicrobiota bacterium]|nr:isocitrate lyase/phosphoenolpyruvate mutase family protein [Elusimicrobiota bacterium]